MIKHYAQRDIRALDRQVNFYCQHVSAMTGEQLNDKSAIAAELAHRDMIIQQQGQQLDEVRAENAELCRQLSMMRGA